MSVGRFPVRFGTKIIAIGRNYADHAKEMGATKPLTEPIFFLKPPSSIVRKGGSIEVPKSIGKVHYEVELAVVMGHRVKRIPEGEAMEAIAGYALALDMTARDLQAAAKDSGMPWSRSKGYDTFLPLSDQILKSEVLDPQNLELWLKVDGELKQKGKTHDMLFSVPKLISFCSNVMTLEEGDIILTGTPAGVGPYWRCGYLRSSAFRTSAQTLSMD